MPPLMLICVAHAAALWWLTTTLSRSPALITPPAVVGVLVSEAPVTAEPKPLPIAEPQSRPQPVVRSTPVPPSPDAPPSERAVSMPPPEPPAVTESSDQPEAAPPAASTLGQLVDEPAQPMTPPRADASFLNNPAPAYPPLSRRLREQGRVLMDVYILADGRVGQINLKRSSGYARLDEAALNAVRRWRYVPAKRGNDPIDYWHVQPLDFELSP